MTIIIWIVIDRLLKKVISNRIEPIGVTVIIVIRIHFVWLLIFCICIKGFIRENKAILISSEVIKLKSKF